MDIALIQNETGLGFDIARNGADLLTDQGLRTAVIYSLFTDRRAADDDILPDGTNDRRGHWGDAYLKDEGDSEGSRLWLLSREKEIVDVLNRAKEYAEEALAWLIDDGIATSVQVTTQWVRRGLLGLHVVITLREGAPFSDNFNYPLEAA
ncbi:phage GP46 family protein [Sulfuriflexus mobilis]|uniref:phage GP46 family protein n=1 Tax=Sulfuriflexus mobilis TaxID=1811807 RepID=UPI000F839186|nr:phage GP46 family protein [Sulfuriflexus mobilis]